MNCKALTLIVIIAETACSMQSNNEDQKIQEMSVFYDPEIHKQKIDTFLLKTPYNIHLLWNIILHTEQHGEPPTDTLQLFQQFMDVSSNYIAFGPFITSQVKKFSENPSKVEPILLKYSQLACLNHLEQNLPEKLDRVKKSKAKLEKLIKKKLNHSIHK